MAMGKKLTLADVEKMLPIMRKGVKQFGAQFSVPYSLQQLTEALLVLADQANLDAPTREEYNTLARQLGACKSRQKKAEKAEVANSPETGIQSIEATEKETV